MSIATHNIKPFWKLHINTKLSFSRIGKLEPLLPVTHKINTVLIIPDCNDKPFFCILKRCKRHNTCRKHSRSWRRKILRREYSGPFSASHNRIIIGNKPASLIIILPAKPRILVCCLTLSLLRAKITSVSIVKHTVSIICRMNFHKTNLKKCILLISLKCFIHLISLTHQLGVSVNPRCGFITVRCL